ncbi:MAG: hypothetical protein QME12_07455 [Nanoarchaeota archaeon]|nr:hypothetical protein [Nanoarchaeota archaeon]
MQKEFWKNLNKKWAILAAMVAFDGISCHYPAIFFGKTIREPNPFTGYLLNTFGAASVFALIPLAIFALWLVVTLTAKYAISHEKRYKTLKEAENGILNYVLVAYSVIIAGEILMLAGRFSASFRQLLSFYYNNQWLNKISGTFSNYLLVVAVIVIAVFIYSIYDKIKWKKSMKGTKSSGKNP